MRARLMRPFEWRVWHLYLMAGVASVVVLMVFGAGVVGSLYLRGLSHRETTRNRVTAANNRRSITNLARIQRLEKPPTQAQLTAAALRALAAIRACAMSPSCRRQNPGVQRVARNLGTGRIPAPRARRRTGGGSSGGATTGGNGTTTAPSPTPRPRGPTQTGRRPQPTTRPSAPAPPPTNPPAARPPAAPPAQSTPAPAPQPPAPVPTVTAPPTPTVPPVPPVVPPVTVPVPIRICAPPLIVVNCRNPQSGAIRSAEAEADPASNSGRGSADDPLCERLKVPCDDAGNPVFPPGLIRLP